MQSEFGDALAGCQAAWRSESIASAFLSRPSLEAQRAATKTLGAFPSSRTDRAGLPDESLDHGPHCWGSPAEVRNPISPRPRRSLDAQLEMDPSETRATRVGAGWRKNQTLETKWLAPGKKNAARLGAHIVFADESGFLLIPLVVRTWAPEGQTPIHRHRQGRRDKISVISGISLSPKRQQLGLYYLLFFDNIGQQEVCVFLQELLRHLRGPVIVLLDNSSTHKGEPLLKLLHQHPRLSIEYFPSYAPQLNPDEGVWSLAKRDLANSCPKNVDELMEDILRSIERIKVSPEKLRGCILQSELPSFLC
jgi:transposase